MVMQEVAVHSRYPRSLPLSLKIIVCLFVLKCVTPCTTLWDLLRGKNNRLIVCLKYTTFRRRQLNARQQFSGGNCMIYYQMIICKLVTIGVSERRTTGLVLFARLYARTQLIKGHKWVKRKYFCFRNFRNVFPWY